MKRLVLIDANALVHRAFHALPPLTTRKGELTNAIYGFSSILLRVINELNPDYMAAAYDLPAPTFRHKEYKDYKATRPKAPDELYEQIPKTKEVLKAFNISILEKQGFEADDVIGTVAKKMTKNKIDEIIILTGDLDTLQLIDNKIKVYTLKKGLSDTIIYGEKEAEERYGLKIKQLVDYKGLRGDPSDNIPGVKGIGEKTATSLLKKFGTIENLYKYLDKLNERTATTKPQKKQKRKKDLAVLRRAEGEFGDSAVARKILTPRIIRLLKQDREMAFFSKKLATIREDVPLKFNLKDLDWQRGFNINEVKQIFARFNFQTLLKRLPGYKPVLSSDRSKQPEQQNLL